MNCPPRFSQFVRDWAAILTFNLLAWGTLIGVVVAAISWSKY